jgi:hypothetical protein
MVEMVDIFGATTSISGSPTYYAGGGGGGMKFQVQQQELVEQVEVELDLQEWTSSIRYSRNS